MSAIGDQLREFAELADKNPDWTAAGCVATRDGMRNETFTSSFDSSDQAATHIGIGIYNDVVDQLFADVR